MTKPMRTLGGTPRHFYGLDTGLVATVGGARIAVYLHLPQVLSEFGIELRDVVKAAGVRADIFDDPENLISYPDVGRLLSVSARLADCDHIGLLVGQRAQLADMGLLGQATLCRDTVGEGLQSFVELFTLQNSAATTSLIPAGDFTQFVYAIAEPSMLDTGHIQLGAITMAFNILQELCGPAWLPALVTVASRAPSNLRPCQKFFRAPLRFDSSETALVFESHWLDRPLPPVDPRKRRQIMGLVRARQSALLADFPATLRRILRKQLIIGDCSMDSVAALVGMHRRTLDRRLRRHGELYGAMLESAKCDVACQLLRDTNMPVQQVAAALRYASAGNFATAFRRWNGVTPSAYRRSAKSRIAG
jgi:AraC-like DNA-binding protein